MITQEISDIIRLALEEDLTEAGDATTGWLIDPERTGDGWVEARQDAIVSGLTVFKDVFEAVDPELEITLLCEDGAQVHSLNRVATVAGNARSIFRAERTALNFLSHLSGVATLTAGFVEMTREWGPRILCTRKTTPGLRAWEVAAVRHGGGDTYRDSLSDRVLVKDNHLGVIGGLDGLEQRFQLEVGDPQYLTTGKLEVLTMADLERAVKMGWRQLLLDNFTVEQVAEAVERWGKVVHLEASGGISRENVRDYAATGVHAISIGELTHSAPIVDFSLEVDWER